MGIKMELWNFLVILSLGPISGEITCMADGKPPVVFKETSPDTFEELEPDLQKECNEISEQVCVSKMYGVLASSQAGHFLDSTGRQTSWYIKLSEHPTQKAVLLTMPQFYRINDHFMKIADSRSEDGKLYALDITPLGISKKKMTSVSTTGFAVTGETPNTTVTPKRNCKLSNTYFATFLEFPAYMGLRAFPMPKPVRVVEEEQRVGAAQKVPKSAGCKCKKTDRPVPSKDSAEPSVHPKPDQPVPPKGDDESDNDRLGFVFDSI